MNINIISTINDKVEELIFDEGNITYVHDMISEEIKVSEAKFKMITEVIEKTLHELLLIPYHTNKGKWKVVMGDEDFEGSMTGLLYENFDLTDFISMHLGKDVLAFGHVE